jgi:hypothetical protein
MNTETTSLSDVSAVKRLFGECFNSTQMSDSQQPFFSVCIFKMVNEFTSLKRINFNACRYYIVKYKLTRQEMKI